MSDDLNTRAQELYAAAEEWRRLQALTPSFPTRPSANTVPPGYGVQVTQGARGSNEPPLTVSATGATWTHPGAVYGQLRADSWSYTRLSPTGQLSQMMGRLFNGTVTGVDISYADYPNRAKLQLEINVPFDISLETVQANILRVCQELKTQPQAPAPGKRRLLKLEEEA